MVGYLLTGTERTPLSRSECEPVTPDEIRVYVVLGRHTTPAQGEGSEQKEGCRTVIEVKGSLRNGSRVCIGNTSQGDMCRHCGGDGVERVPVCSVSFQSCKNGSLKNGVVSF